MSYSAGRAARAVLRMGPWRQLSLLSSLLLLACADDSEPLVTAGANNPGYLTAACIEQQCFGGLVCDGGLCVGGSGGGPTGSPSGDPDGDPTGSPTGSPTGDTSGGPGGDPTGSTTGGPTSDPTVTSGPGPTSDSDATTAPPLTTGEPNECKNVQVAAPATNLIFVVDRSGSFSVGTWDHDENFGTAEIPKWTSLHKTLTAVIGKYQAKHRLGLMMFPSSAATSSYSESACVTNASPEVAPALGNGGAIGGQLPPADAMLKGGTPMARGLDGALSALTSIPASEARAMVLIGDGSPNCAPGVFDTNSLFEDLDGSVHAIVGDAWSSDKIPTAVVGVNLPNSYSQALQDGNPDNANPFAEFDQLAVEGGRPRAGSTKFYDAYSEAELASYLDAAVRSTLGCEVAINATPADPTATSVSIAGMNYSYSPNLDCASGDGWVYTDGSNSRIRLCGAACDALLTNGGAQVNLDCP
jgi:hypothetical protein